MPVRRIIGGAAFALATAIPLMPHYFWEFVRSVIYEYLSWGFAVLVTHIPLEVAERVGSSALFAAVGAYLFLTTGKKTAATAPVVTLPVVATPVTNGPQVTKWLPPTRAIEEFADKALVSTTIRSLNEAKSLKAERDKENEGKGPYEVIANTNDLFKRTQDAELAFYVARHAVLQNLIEQLKQGDLIGRAMPFDEKKLSSHQDWEIIKSPHWSVLEFDTSDTSLETVRGGGRTYKGLQIGKPQ